MKIVVLGATGFIGSAVARCLREKSINRIAIGTSAKGPRLDERSDWLDVAIEGADVLYQCAGRTGGVGRMANDPLSFVYPNVKIHMSVFEACAKAGVKRVVCLNSTTGYPD